MPSFGTLKADTLTHSTAGSLDTNYVVNGPKGFASTKHDGTEIYESFNISTLTDNATGKQLLTLSISFSGATYLSLANSNSSQNDWGHAGTITKTTSTCDTSAYDAGGSYQDNNMATIFAGDLA